MPSVGSLFASLTLESSQFVQGTKQAAQEAKNMSSQVNDSFGSTKGAMDSASGGVAQFSSALKASRLEMNNSRIGMMEFGHIARGMSDQFASGGLSAQLFTSHIGELAEAVSLSGGAFGKLGLFLQTGWGMAATMAVTVIGTLIGAHLNAKDAAQKHQSAEETLTGYINGEAVATDALRTAMEKLLETRQKSLETTNEQIRAEYGVANATMETAKAQLSALQTQLGAAKGQLYEAQAEQARAASGGKGAIDAASGAASSAQAKVDKLQQEVGDLTTTISRATATMDADMTQLARNTANHVGQVKDAYDKLQQQLEERYRGKETTTVDRATGRQTHTFSGGLFDQPGANRAALAEQLRQAEAKLDIQRREAVDRAEKLDSAEAGLTKTREKEVYSGNQISFAEAAQIASGAGYQVNSSQRTYADQKRLYDQWVAAGKPRDNPVAPPGTSAHEGANGKWALDIQIKGDPKVEASNLKKLFGDRGVDVKVFPERGHLHVSGSRSEAAAADRSANRAAEQLANATDSFNNRSTSLGDQLDKEIAAAKVKLVGSIHDQALTAGEEADAQKQQLYDQIDALATEAKKKGVDAKTVDAETAILKAKADQLDKEKHAAIALKEYVDTLQQQNTMMKQQLDAQIGHLQFLDTEATSQAERRKIELEILTLERQEKETALQNLLKEQQAKGDVGGAALTQDQINNLPQEFADKQQGIVDKTMGPLDAWLKTIPHDAATVNEALQSIAVEGLDGISSAVAGVVSGTETLRQAFASIAQSILADITKMIVKMLIFKALTAIFGGGNPMAGLGLGGTGPAVPLPDLSATVPVAFAIGGDAQAGQPYWVGEKGPEMFVPNSSGKIVSNSMSGGGSQVVNFNIDARGSTDPAQVKQQAYSAIMEAMPLINQSGFSFTMRKLGRPAGLGLS